MNAEAMSINAEEHGGSHASPGFYWVIGGILTVLTAVEVAVFYIPALHGVLVPLLLTLSVGKFALVVMFFMHLKFDSRVFSGVFLAGLVLATFMTVALVVIYKVLPEYQVLGVG
jgi:cytochrome c oxidase subunit 4